MQQVAVFFDDPGENEYPFSVELYRTVYRQLGETMAALGGQLCIVRGPQTHLEGNTFSHAWKFDGTWFRRIEGPVHFSLVWNKGRCLRDPSIVQINHYDLDAICLDKWMCYELFPNLLSKTVYVESADALGRAMDQMRTERIVLKPQSGYGGFNVIIGGREEVQAKNTLYPCIVQEFVDTSEGIEGLVDGMHDFRIIAINGEVGLSYIRTPPPNMFTANVSQGGREIEVPPGKIPPQPLRILAEVDRVFARFTPRIYTVDMGRGKDGAWCVFEINAKPGFSPVETGPSYQPFYRRLCALLLAAA